MKGSLLLGRMAGIKIYVHWTFTLLILWVIFLEITRGGNLTSMIWSTAFVLVLFFCVVLHELGHALTARKFNIGTRKITLLPIGGVASLESMPENPWEEFLVAVAGPAVNVVIAALLFMVVPVEHFLNQDPEALEQGLSSINSSNFMFYLFSANVLLIVFNMLPAFPMDGGRVFRALLAMKFDRMQATRMAAGMGQFIAFFLFFVGLLFNPILILIAIFIYFGAQSESLMVQQLGLLKSFKVEDAMMTDVTPIHPDDTLDDVVDVILTGTERDFVVSRGDEVLGVLYQSDLMESFKNKSRDSEVKDIMTHDFETLEADEPLADIYTKIRGGRQSYFPVTKGGKLVGAIDINNLNEFMMLRAPQNY